MNVKQDNLKAYQSFKTDSAQRVKTLKAEAREKQAQIDEDKKKYNELLQQDKDSEALELLNDIEQGSREIKHIANKISMLSEREQEAKASKVQAVLDEYQTVKQAYQKELQKEEEALEKIKSEYIKQVGKTLSVSNELANISMRYTRVANENGRSKEAIKMNVPHRKQAGSYTIETQDIIKGGK